VPVEEAGICGSIFRGTDQSVIERRHNCTRIAMIRVIRSTRLIRVIRVFRV
jgi:hypothetical protein